MPAKTDIKSLSIEPVIQSSWKQTRKNVKASKDGYQKARDWQIPAFKTLVGEQFGLLNAPMGSGKSWLMKAIAAAKALSDHKMRLVIAVPQTIIGNGFLSAKLTIPGTTTKVDWKPTHNLLNGVEESNVSYIVNFLAKRSNAKTPLNDRVLICTHSTLVHLQKTLKNTKRFDLLRNLMVWVDEGHHSKNADMIEDSEVVISNGIGQFIKDLIHARRRNVHVGLATASYFRGDRCSVLTEEMESRFTRFNLPYDEYLESMEHLKSFSVGFMFSNSNYIEAVSKLVHERRGKDIVFFPHPQHRHYRGNKLKDVKDFRAELAKLYGKKITTDEYGVVTFQQPAGKDHHPSLLKKDGRPYRHLDLVDETNRQVKKEFTQTINDSRDAVDCITSIGMFKEGANWVFADRAIIVGHRESLVEIVQTIGRLFRDCAGKKHVEVVIVLPWAFDQADREKFREDLNNYLKAVYALMILEDVIMPPDITEYDATPSKPGNGGGRLDPIKIYVPDENIRIKLNSEASSEMMKLADETNGSAGFDDYVRVTTAVCKKMKIDPKGVQEVAKRLVLKHSRRTLQMKGVDITKINLELLKSVNPVEWIVDFTTRQCDIVTFRELRRRISNTGKNYPPIEFVREQWQLFLQKNPGVKNTSKNYMKWADGGFETPEKPRRPVKAKRRKAELAASIV